MIIDGRRIQARMLGELQDLRKTLSREPILGIIFVGDDAGSKTYINEKKKFGAQVGCSVIVQQFPATISRTELRKGIAVFKKQRAFDGLIIQLPLPKNLNTPYILESIDEKLDVDVLTERSWGKFAKGRLPFNPPVVQAVEEIIAERLGSKKEVIMGVIGRGALIGNPVTIYCLRKGFTVINMRRQSEVTPQLLKLCDIIISGVGKGATITTELVKDGALCIDFGYSKDPVTGKVVGDFDFEALNKRADIAITPPIGGTGPITVACLFKNLLLNTLQK